jgi:integrase/recombinase XerD
MTGIVPTTLTVKHPDQSLCPLLPSGGMAISEYLSRFATEVGRRTMQRCLTLLASWQGCDLMDWEPHRLGVIGVRAIAERIRNQGWKPATQAKHEAALAGVIKSCWRFGLLDTDTAHRMQDWRRVKVQRGENAQAAGRYVTREERARLWKAAETMANTEIGRLRDKALLVLLLCGLRREECASLRMENLKASGALEIPGKGSKYRQIPIEPWQHSILTEWIRARGDAPGELLAPINRHGDIAPSKWSLAAVSKRADQIAKTAGVAGVACHDFRRTFASDALASGVDITLVARWMGHSSVRTTQSYDRRGLDTLRQVGRSVWQPF